MDLNSAYAGKTVWISGHTGFKGSWLSEWLLGLGARVIGYALPPPTNPALFDQLGLASRLIHVIGDINDAAAVKQSIHLAQPDYVFHLAAQPLVRFSYQQPVETFQTNVMGTINVLEALRSLGRPCSAVFITTDKCYENRESFQAYREDDPLGGHDPYSASKAAAEIAIAAYRKSFFTPGQTLVRVASARAGNVIGGGDWAVDRIVPDSMRSLGQGLSIAVRNPESTRPWQHVLEPLGGYLTLAARLAAAQGAGLDGLSGAFNFGPNDLSNRSVRALVEEILRFWPGTWTRTPEANAVHEAGLLHLAHEKAFLLLDWSPRWDFSTTVAKTVEWYRYAAEKPGALPDLTRGQIESYQNHATR